MEIGRISQGLINNTINSVESVKSSVEQDSFEKKLQDAIDNNNEEQLKAACKEFEGIMLSMIYKQMKSAIPKSDLIPSDAGRDIFESMLDEALMEEASNGRGVGLADVLYKQLSRNLSGQLPENNEGSNSGDTAEIMSVEGESSGE
ncbi:MAG TPA: flagellar biosynthesis protein FlgJ [Clostridiaceae bacterium]|nr:flagellar biosynthesis protein FlgJ [Clostridiaceae bacterium]